MTSELDSLKQQEQKAQGEIIKSNFGYNWFFSIFDNKKIEIAESEVESVAKYRETVEQQLESNREFHQRQVSRLRNEIDAKQKQIESLREKNSEVCTESDRIKSDLAVLQSTAKEKDEKITAMTDKLEKTDQAKNDLRRLEETGLYPNQLFFLEFLPFHINPTLSLYIFQK